MVVKHITFLTSLHPTLSSHTWKAEYDHNELMLTLCSTLNLHCGNKQMDTIKQRSSESETSYMCM